MMLDVACAQVGRHLGLPTHAYMGLSDAKLCDYQAGAESGIGAVLAALAGINLVSGPGMLDYLLSQSLEKLLLDHEACGMALRLARGIAVRGGGGCELIAALAGSGEALSSPHTRRHWREELSLPSPLFDRETHGDWEAHGASSALQRAAAEVTRRLGRAAPPLDAALAGRLDALIAAEAARHGLHALPGLDSAPAG